MAAGGAKERRKARGNKGEAALQEGGLRFSHFFIDFRVLLSSNPSFVLEFTLNSDFSCGFL